jgi:hypothetical protein
MLWREKAVQPRHTRRNTMPVPQREGLYLAF